MGDFMKIRKSIAAIIGILLIFVFSGCAKQDIKAEEIDFIFNCKANVTFEGQKLTCQLNRTAPEIINIQIISGDLNGLIYDWDGEGFSISYSGITAKSENSVLPKAAFAEIIKQTLDCACKDGALTKTHGNEFAGKYNDMDFTIATDGNGQISKITIPQRGITAELYEYTEQGP
jgi:hypothetical protein